MKRYASSPLFRSRTNIIHQYFRGNANSSKIAIADITSRDMGTWPKIRPKRIRVITMDITGTLVSFRGSLKEHYLGSAEKCGVQLPDEIPIKTAFAQAYKECSHCTWLYVHNP
jgi:hypothetical protein